MDTEFELKKRVSNLESIGRKICSDLRNFQKERTILSQEAKCLMRKIEKVQARRQHYNKQKHSNNTSCTCAIWENDLIKDGGSDHEESTKFQKEDEQLLTCDSCCRCCDVLDEENYHDLFEIDECPMCRFNELGEPFYYSQSVTNINDVDADDNDNNSRCFDENNTVKDNINDLDCIIRSCDECTIDSTKFCDICVFCKANNAKNMHVLSTNDKLNINNESDKQDLLERQRGGGGRSDSESTNDGTTNTSICTCDCDICALRNKHGPKPPCCLPENEQLDRSSNVDNDENLQLNRDVDPELSEIHQYCKITKLREALEKLKNRNHTLRKLLKKRDCLKTNSMIEQANYSDKSLRDGCKETPRELTAILKILQSKCRTKDGMIVALADELKECASNERIKRILDKLTDSSVHCNIIDFDRSTLWRYLISKQFNTMQQYSCIRKSIVANIHYRYRCTIIFVFHTICVAFYRTYEIFQNCHLCFASNHIMIFIMKNSINIIDAFLSLFNCQLSVNTENIMHDFTFFSDDGFPWLSTICICATIFILFYYRICYSFITMCNESLQCIYNTHRNDVPNDDE